MSSITWSRPPTKACQQGHTTSRVRKRLPMPTCCGHTRESPASGAPNCPSTVSLVTSAVLPVPGGLASDLVESLDHPMMASDAHLRDVLSDPPGGLVGIDEAI